MILTCISPPGVSTLTVSPTLCPTKLWAIGDSFEILPANGSASAKTYDLISFWFIIIFLKTTVLPIATSSAAIEPLSMISAWFNMFSTSLIRPSSIDCSFFAASYSEFSDRSPKERAILIRSMISARLVVRKFF